MKCLVEKTTKVENYILEKGSYFFLEQSPLEKEKETLQAQIEKLTKQKETTTDEDRKKSLQIQIDELKVKLAQNKVEKDKQQESISPKHSVQIPMKSFINDIFLEYQKRIDDSILYTEEGYGRELYPHITVAYGFLNEIDYIEMDKYLKLIPQFEIELGDISIFEADNYDVLKVDINSIPLTQLHYDLISRFANIQTYPEYKPHMTLAYIKKGMFLDTINPFKEKSFIINKLEFSHANNVCLPLNLKIETKVM